MIRKKTLIKPDGRKQILYSRRPIPDGIKAPSPELNPLARSSHLRYNPMLDEWNIYAVHRQNRTFLPPPEYNPLAPTADDKFPTEVPAGDYDVTVFDNLFPSLGSTGVPPELIVPTAQAEGAAEVVVYTQDPFSSLGRLPLSQVELVLEVWADRYQELGGLPDVKYVYCFENRGVEVGVTLQHPHGQIYAYPFVPPIARKALNIQKEFYEKTGKNLLGDHIQKEIKDNRRIIFIDDHAVAFIPVFARYAYEVWIAPVRSVASLANLTPQEMLSVATALKTVLLKFDQLWNRPFPYIMAWHQAPTDGNTYPETHAHVEFYPPYRMQNRLKYLAGSEIGAGAFTADTLPEEKAEELRNVKVSLI